MNLIVCDIREDLAKDLIADVKKAAKDPAFKHIHFYRANLANAAEVEDFWARITAEHGPIHVLVNNAARCLGKRVDELSLQQVKLTMDINFHSYVQLIMLFQAQQALQGRERTDFHLVNVSSIAGHLSCQRNSDYSASKFALNGFVDALRQEVECNYDRKRFNRPPYVITNVYPYFINTGLFEGFEPRLRFLLPTLDSQYVVDRIYNAILAEEREVYIRGIIFYLKSVNLILPLSVRNWANNLLVGEGMEHFVGRLKQESAEKKAQ